MANPTSFIPSFSQRDLLKSYHIHDIPCAINIAFNLVKCLLGSNDTE